MKRWTFLAVVLLVLMAVLPAAAAGPTDLPNGQHYEIHLIGSPKGISGDYSNGRTIMIPLKTAKTGTAALTCGGEEVIYDPDPELYFTDQVPNAGVKLYWKLGPTFEIVDRDATDGSATIQIPWDPTSVTPDDPTPDLMDVDVWVRIHGKPGTCLKATAWAQDFQLNTDYYWLAGSIQLNRKTGKAAWTNVNDLFDVMWCELQDVNGVVSCVPGTEKEYSVFDDQFLSYFWDIENNGARNVEIRLYPH